ncbi:MAG TPA: ABC transporter permease [Proteobacteria bacterium]|nr:ABC transporter permease [Pseudomonadota bacterium]
MIIIKLAWRNLWRNVRRTLITISAMSLALSIMILTLSLVEGMHRQMVHYATRLFAGDIQIHKKGYFESKDIYDYLSGGGADTLAAVRRPGLHASPRLFGSGLASSGENSTGTILWGIDPQQERRVTELSSHLLKGGFLTSRSGKEVVLGKMLAENLKVDVGDELVILTQAADGSLGNDIFSVRGVLQSIGDEIDRGAVIMGIDELGKLLVLPDKVHEIAISLSRPEMVDGIQAQLEKILEGKGVEVCSWKEIFPQIKEMLELNQVWMYIMLLIVFGLASLGVLNTMLMALFERTREFGLVMALGLRPLSIVGMILLETLLLSLVSTVVGAAVGIGLSSYLAAHGWNLSRFSEGFSMSGLTVSTTIYAHLSMGGVFASIICMILVSLVAAFYPAIKAARLEPVSALSTVG